MLLAQVVQDLPQRQPSEVPPPSLTWSFILGSVWFSLLLFLMLPLTTGGRRPADLRGDTDSREPGRAAERRGARQHQELLQVQPHLEVQIRPTLPQGHQRQGERVQGTGLKEAAWPEHGALQWLE